MAQTESRIRLIFDGSERGVAAAAARASAAIRGLDDSNSRLSKSASKAEAGLLGIGKGMLALSAANSAVKVIGGTVGALQQLAPIALLLPGALAGGAAAMGTFKIATAGMGDALKAGLSGDMKKFAEATKDMAPAMQQSAKAVAAFKPQIDDLKKSVQGEFWKGLNTEIAKTGSNLLPALQREMPGVAQGFNAIGTSALKAAQSGFFKSDIQIILFNTGRALKALAPAAGDALAGFVSLGAAGTSFLPRLSAAISDVAVKFRAWVDTARADGSLDRMIEGAIQGFKDLGGIVKNVGSILGSVFTGLGGVVESPLARIRELTAQVAEFLKTAAAQDGLRALGETLQVVGDVVGRVVMAAFKELAPTLVALAPIAQEVARTLGDLLVNALETLGPVVRGIASVFNTFPGLVGPATTAVVGFVATVKTIKAINAVTELLGIGRAVDDVDKKAGAAAGPGGGLGRFKGALKIGAVIGVGAVIAAFGDVEKAASSSTDAVDRARGAVGLFTQAAGSLDLGFFLHEFIEEVKFGQTIWEQFKNGISGFHPEPINFSVNTGPAQDQVTTFMNSIKGRVASVTIDGRTENAAQALADIVQAINLGRGSVNIDGRDVPAQEALTQVIRMIDTAVGMVSINGEDKPAGQVLAGFLQRANDSKATAQLGANPQLAYETVGGWTRAAEGTVGMAALDANKQPADGKVGEWVGGVSRTRGTATLDANPGPANTQLGGWQGRANATTGTSKLNADPGQANAQTSGWQGRANSTTGMARLNADTGPATSALNAWKAAASATVVTVKAVLQKIGFANGGPVLAGFAGGGAISGRGTGTSDSIPAMLSHGEHVLTAREVAAAGGHAAIFALRRSLSKGQVPRMYATGGRAATGGAVSGASAFSIPTPQVSVSVHIGNREITDIVRTQIQASNRLTRRTVGMGAGTTF